MTLAPGTKAVIKPRPLGNGGLDADFTNKWQDFPVEILRYDENAGIISNRGMYYCLPLEPRRDGVNDPYYAFFWDAEEVEEAGPVAQDMLGKTINVGDTVVYPNRYGSTLEMIKAEVVDVGEKDNPYRWGTNPKTVPYIKIKAPHKYSAGEYTAHVTHLERVVRVN